MEALLYKDSAISISSTEIRAKGFTLYLRNVTSVSIVTVRPGMMAPIALVPLGVMYWTISKFVPFQNIPTASFIPILPLVALVGAYFFFRICRLRLQTSGGPVILASSLAFWNPVESLERYERIKSAIERAIAKQAVPVRV
jgi:hypothetical protein